MGALVAVLKKNGVSNLGFLPLLLLLRLLLLRPCCELMEILQQQRHAGGKKERLGPIGEKLHFGTFISGGSSPYPSYSCFDPSLVLKLYMCRGE
uniref:Secreted protein n=1 Tax=Physcomitrium patens TaxID=3218 RepID=A0A2K1KXB3_PHYPA|nr:hypothetical protein PHYPA_005381 [Physcomitrium patens]